MSLLELFKAADTKDSNKLADVVELERHFMQLQDSLEGLRFSKRDLAHELSLVTRENARLERQLDEIRSRLDTLEAMLEGRLHQH